MNEHAEKIEETFPDIFKNVVCHPDTTRNQFIQKNPVLIKIAQSMSSQGVSPTQANTTANMYYHVARYKVCGCKDYMVMPKLSAMLDATSLDSDYELLKSPYAALAIEPPPGYEKIYNEQTGEHKVKLVYVTFDENADHKEIRFMIVGKPNSKNAHALDDAFFYFRTEIKKDRTLQESLDEDANKMIRDTERLYKDKELILKNIEKTRRVFNYCLNVLMYVNSVNADKKWREVYPHHVESKIKKLKDMKRVRKLRKINKSFRKCILGENIITSYKSKEDHGQKWSLSKRVHVSGHYHKYWYGSGDKKELKPRWVKPYWKGPETADTIHTKIQVGKE